MSHKKIEDLQKNIKSSKDIFKRPFLFRSFKKLKWDTHRKNSEHTVFKASSEEKMKSIKLTIT